MALIDYKIRKLSHEKRHVSINVAIYRGRIQDVTQYDFMTGNDVVTPNVYVRIAKMREFTIEYDVPRDMTRQEFLTKAQAYLNNKILTYAQNNNHTVISVQHDITKLEPVTNEKEI